MMEEARIITLRGFEYAIERLGVEDIEEIMPLNRILFDEERLINSFAREDIRIWVARSHGDVVGFKVGYRESRTVFYSAKGGVHPDYRRLGIARALLHVMADASEQEGYRRLAFDTFPNRHPGMTVMALEEGFRLVRADYNPTYRDYRLRFELDLRSR
jgi:ribosomal protein S18 acetylase RimI-like enzyme